MAQSNAELIHEGFEAAARGDVEAVAALLDPDVYWGAEGGGGCENRDQALGWMSEAIARGVRVRPVETRELADDLVLVVLQRSALGNEGQPPPPHAQLVRFRDGKVVEMVVYPTVEDALSAAQPA